MPKPAGMPLLPRVIGPTTDDIWFIMWWGRWQWTIQSPGLLATNSTSAASATPTSTVFFGPQVVLGCRPPSVPVTTPKDFLAYAKTKPGALTYGTSGPGSLHNLGMELFQSITGTELIHVPYKGSGPALVDLVAGQINMMFTSTTSGAGLVKNGKLKAIAVTSPKRVPVYPELPTLAETVAPGYELGNKYSIFAPAGTPKPVLTLLNREVSRIVNSGDVKDKFAADGADPAPPVSVERFRSEYNSEVSKWEKFTRAMKVKL